MFRYHVVGCRQLRGQDLLEEGYVTTLSGHPLRFSEKEVSPGPARSKDQRLSGPAHLHPGPGRSHFPWVRAAPDRAHYHGPLPGLRTSEHGLSPLFSWLGGRRDSLS